MSRAAYCYPDSKTLLPLAGKAACTWRNVNETVFLIAGEGHNVMLSILYSVSDV